MEKDFDSKLRIESNSSNGGNIPRSKSFELGRIYGVGSYSKVILDFILLHLNVEDQEEELIIHGMMEYEKGNVEGALSAFDGIDLQAAVQELQPLAEKLLSKKGRPSNESVRSSSQQAASLVLEALYLKAKSLQKLGRVTEAANECKSVFDAVEKIFYHGIPDVLVDNKLQEIVSGVVELLPELWKLDGSNHEAIRVEVGPPSLAVQIDGSYVPRNNLEEAILLLMILMRKFYLGKTKWDPSVMEHLPFALSLCSQTSVLVKQLEEIMPGVFHRANRWKAMVLCYSGAGQKKAALNLLRKSLHKHEKTDDLTSLLLAAKICSKHALLATEGVGYAQRAILHAQGLNEHLKGVGLFMLGLCLGKLAKVSSSDHERSRLQTDALKSLDEAIVLERNNFDLIFELGVQYAERWNLNAALWYAKQFIDATGGSTLKGWRLLALILSAQQRFSEAEVVTDAALDKTAK
ncbi:hypothetical protein ACSBR1_014094 [Camellia fascicularis]